MKIKTMSIILAIILLFTAAGCVVPETEELTSETETDISEEFTFPVVIDLLEPSTEEESTTAEAAAVIFEENVERAPAYEEYEYYEATLPAAEPEPENYDIPDGSGDTMTFFVTGYTQEEGFYEGDLGASGDPVGPGVCAMNVGQMDSLGLSYGDCVTINGLGTYVILDTGCDWGVIDIWLYTNAEAYEITGEYDVSF